MKIQQIVKDLESNKNIAYINGTKNFPLCIDSAVLCCFIEAKELDVKFISVDNDLSLISELKEYAGDVPALYFDGKLVASGKNLTKLIKSGASKGL